MSATDKATHPATKEAPSVTHDRCLVLACGNIMRGDDGIGWELARLAAESNAARESDIKIVTRGQWTPELAEDVSRASAVLFLDCSADSAPGEVRLRAVKPSAELPRLFTHQLCPADLLALSRDLYQTLPRCALLLTVGAADLGLGEKLSDAVQAALPEAQNLIEEALSLCLPNSH